MQRIAPELLLSGYLQGYFPMSDENCTPEEPYFWVRPAWRGVIPIADFSISKNVQRWIRNQAHTVTINQAFREVMLACADRESTWISDIILESYCHLHETGYAHSVEIWTDGELTGGLYGVSMRAAFFGESMFKRKPEMDKVALYYCWKQLQENDFLLWDTQFYTEHLGTFGCQEISEQEYLRMLKVAVSDIQDEVRFV